MHALVGIQPYHRGNLDSPATPQALVADQPTIGGITQVCE
jgi:hypothetical protein